MALSLIEPHLNKDNANDLIEKVIGKKKEEIEYLLSSLFGKGEKIRDKIRRLPVVQETGNPLNSSVGNKAGGDEEGEVKESSLVYFHSGSERGIDENGCREIRRVKVEFVCDEGVAGLIERAKEIMRHKYPEARLEDLMREAFELLLEKRDPERKIRRGEKKNEGDKTEQKPEQREGEEQKGEKEKRENQKKQKEEQGTGERTESETAEGLVRKPNMERRYIPEALRREVWGRDHGECTYVSLDGKQCQERRFLELDHMMPWALGGETSAGNLRLLCRAHNQFRAEKTFGKWG